MLIRFGVSNCLSVKDYQEISLVASTHKHLSEHLIRTTGIRQQILPCAVIVGANASGKTNILKSIVHMCNAVRRSYTGLEPGAKIPRVRFLLDEICASKPTEFDCDFILDNVRYTYGFSLTDEVVAKEYLYAYPRGQRQIWVRQRRSEEEPYYFGKHLRGRNAVVRDVTRANSLFLSAAAQHNHKQLMQIYEFFSERVENQIGDEIFHQNEHAIANFLMESKYRDRALEFVKSADFGIVDAKVEDADYPKPVKKLMSGFIEAIKEESATLSDEQFAELSNIQPKTVKLLHKNLSGDAISLNFLNESLGTIKFLYRLQAVLGALDTGGILLIDEIDASLHTLLVRKIIELFTSSVTNKSNAQLILTTHDTNLLSNDLFRRDEIWFAEKDSSGATQLFPLTEFLTRPSDNFERGYLQGRFGAIPFLDELESLMNQD